MCGQGAGRRPRAPYVVARGAYSGAERPPLPRQKGQTAGAAHQGHQQAGAQQMQRAGPQSAGRRYSPTRSRLASRRGPSWHQCLQHPQHRPRAPTAQSDALHEQAQAPRQGLGVWGWHEMQCAPPKLPDPRQPRMPPQGTTSPPGAVGQSGVGRRGPAADGQGPRAGLPRSRRMPLSAPRRAPGQAPRSPVAKVSALQTPGERHRGAAGACAGKVRGAEAQ